MYDVEEITENYEDNSRWFSVINNMRMFRVECSDTGDFYHDEEGNFLKESDEDTKIEIKKAVQKYKGVEV